MNMTMQDMIDMDPAGLAPFTTEPATKNILLDGPHLLVIGDRLIDGSKTIEVKKIEHAACSDRGTHVNGSLCYKRGIPVRVKA